MMSKLPHVALSSNEKSKDIQRGISFKSGKQWPPVVDKVGVEGLPRQKEQVHKDLSAVLVLLFQRNGKHLSHLRLSKFMTF